nr:hypothetical protein [Planctomycetota bacterium]
LRKGDPGDPALADIRALMDHHAEPLVDDLVERVRTASDDRARSRHAYDLIAASPSNPLGRAAMLRSIPGRAPDRGAWHAGPRRHPILLSVIADQYVADQRFDDADACLIAMTALDPTYRGYQRLAEVRWRKGDRFGWFDAVRLSGFCSATPEESREARMTMSRYVASLGDWTEAVAQAEASAAAGHPEGMLFAADCRAHAGHLAESQQWIDRLATAHPDRAPDRFWWCLRWGRGEAEAARVAAATVLAADPLRDDAMDTASLRLAHFLVATGDLPMAERICSARYAARHNPSDGIQLALIRLQVRGVDAGLEVLRTIELDLQHPIIGIYDPPLIGVERWMTELLADPQHAVDLSQIFDYADVSTDPGFIWYAVGRCLRGSGIADIGNRCLDRAITLRPAPHIEAHAAHLLRESGVPVGSLLQNNQDGRGGDF